jgi:hypothetical protein
MRHQQHQQLTPVVAILDTNTLVDRILARLLEDEGYDTRGVEARPLDLIDDCSTVWTCCSSPLT